MLSRIVSYVERMRTPSKCSRQWKWKRARSFFLSFSRVSFAQKTYRAEINKIEPTDKVEKWARFYMCVYAKEQHELNFNSTLFAVLSRRIETHAVFDTDIIYVWIITSCFFQKKQNNNSNATTVAAAPTTTTTSNTLWYILFVIRIYSFYFISDNTQN